MTDDLPDYYFVFDQDKRLVQLHRPNDAVVEIPSHEDVGKGLDHIFPKTVAHLFAEAIDVVHSGRAFAGCHYRLFTPVGKERLFEARFLMNPQGLIHCLARDVSSLRRVVDENAKLALMARHIGSAIILTGPERRIEWVNPAFEKLTGYSLEKSKGKNPRFLQGLNTCPETVRSIRQTLDQKKTFRGELLNYTQSRQPYWIAIEIVPYLEANGRLRGFVSLQTDITKRKLEEIDKLHRIEELKQQNDFLIIAGKLARLGHWEIFTDGRPQVWSPMTYEIFEVPMDTEITEETANRVHHPDDFAPVVEAIEHTLETGKPFSFESRAITPRGKKIWIRSQGIAVTNNDGEITGARGAVQDITDYQEIFQSLRNQEETLDTILQAIPSAIFLKDGQGRMRFINGVGQALAGLKGFRWEGLTDQEIADQVSPYQNIANLCLASDKLAWEARERIVREDVILTSEGMEQVLEVIKIPLFHPDGSRRGLVIIKTDVTDKKRAIETVEQERALFAAGPVAVLIWANEPGYPVDYASANIKKIIGYDAEFLQKEGFFLNNLSHPEEQEQIQRHLWKNLHEQVPVFEHVCRLRHRDGGYRWIFEVIQPEYSPDGKCRKLRSYIIDQTPLKEAETALQNKDLQFAKLVRQVPGMLYSFHCPEPGSFQFSFVSPGCTQLFGIPYDQGMITEKDFLERVHPDDLPGLVDALLKKEEQPLQWSYEFRILHPERGERWLNATSSPREPGNPTSFWDGYCFDITERKRAEGRLLQEGKREAIERLAGGIAHDFNNYLNVLGISSEMLRNIPNLPEKVQKISANISKGVDSAATIARQLLAFSKEQPLHLESIQLDTFLRDCTAFALRGTPVLSFIDVAERDLQICSDPNLLQQAIFNLVLNAREAMKNRGRVMINARLQEGKEEIMIRVADTGPGIPGPQQEHIFEPYFTSKSTGSGLGLFVVQSILRRLGGDIELDSAVTVGATFLIRLPLRLERQGETRAIKEKNEAQGADYQPEDYRILVLEDDPEQKEALSQFFTTLDVNVSFFADGDQLLAATHGFKNHQGPVIALLDITLPGVRGGLDIVTELREELPDARLYLMSGYSADWLQNQGKVAGLKVGFIAKPYRLRELKKRLFG